MYRLSKPNFNVKTIINDCTESIRDPVKKTNYKKCEDFIAEQSDRYDVVASRKAWEKIRQHDNVNHILTKQDMEKLYTEKFAKHITVKPKYYDKIKVLSGGICPICEENVVSNLDHYLAKSLYPTYAITPYNLIPICRDCNSYKRDSAISDLISAPMHPYYDDMDDVIWLRARFCVENEGLVAAYFIDEGIKIVNENLYKRIYNHFKLYHLGKLYSMRAASYIADNKSMWKYQYSMWDKDRMNVYFRMLLNSFEESRKNSWKAALMRELIKDIDILAML